MRADLSKLRGIYLNYYVMFSADKPTEPYTPIIGGPISNSIAQGEMHNLDPELKGILPALWYCLHLPRNGFDTMDLAPEVIAKGYSVPHSILPIPSYINDFESLQHNMVQQYPPTLVISEDSCYESAVKFATDFEVPLGSVRLSNLSNEVLRDHWKAITQLIQKLPIKDGPLYVEPKLLSERERSALPLIFLANQLKIQDKVLSHLNRYDFSQLHRFHHSFNMRSMIEAMVVLAKRGIMKPSEALWAQVYQQQQQRTKVPLVITLPGTAGRIRPKGSSGVHEVESSVTSAVNILGVHRAAARGGVWLDGGTLPTWLFSELHNLENHCKASLSQKNNRFIWESMKRIGEFVVQQLGTDGTEMLMNASHVTAITDFPIGLAILPGLDDPLCCMKPISYRPLTPVTRTLQLELPRAGEHYIGRGFKVVIAECLGPDDKIRGQSDAAWKIVHEMFKSEKNVQIVYSEVGSIPELHDLLMNNRDSDILVISAHGAYDEHRNFAGLCIGDNIWMADNDDIRVPPVVILSACHVAPRGLGAVTVNDLLFRAGARTVLGTLIPVDVRRNATLTVRLFTYILNAIKGGRQFRSLDEAWEFVVASNAVHEILASSKRLLEWSLERLPGKLSPIEEFMSRRSIGRLRKGHVYTDTFDILSEIADEHGMREHLEAVKSSPGFFPESCFYVLTGAPENVIISERVFEKLVDQGFTR